MTGTRTDGTDGAGHRPPSPDRPPPGHRLPPGPRLPRALQTAGFLAVRAPLMRAARRRYGSVFTLDLALFGRTVVVCDRDLIKQVFTTPTDVLGNNEVNLGSVLGPGSTFALDGDEHRRQRKVLLPPFAGKRMQAYETVFERATVAEAAGWPTGTPLSTMDPMNRITLTVILQAVFGAEGREFDELRVIIPPLVTLASQLSLLRALRRDLGPWSPWGRFLRLRRRFDDVVDRLIAQVRADPDLEQRADVLALMVQCRYDDGSPMTDSAIRDQMLTVLAAGHETTATTLAWALERLSRHPAVLEELVAEVDAGRDELLQATVLEVQRTRSVIDLVAREVVADSARIGNWVLPRGTTVMVSIESVQSDDTVFPDAARFDPHRFVGVTPDHYGWVPYGGGTRRCLGSAFANLEMTVVLRTLLRTFEVAGTYDGPEPARDRGVAIAPGRGGQVVLHRRTTASLLPAAVA